METGGFLTGIPLGAVKTARFLNKAGTFFTLAKLIYNGNTYRFSSAQDGAVTANADFLSWKFIGPDGRFDLDTLAAGTAAEMLEAMADTCQESPVPAWEDFALWLAEDVSVKQVNTVFSGCSRAVVAGVEIQVPVFTAPADFSGFLQWLVSVMGEAGELPASGFRNSGSTNRFDVFVDLYQPAGQGMQIQEYRLVTPAERPSEESLTVFRDGASGIFYHNSNGALSLPCLLVSAGLCPTAGEAYPGYDFIVYVYEQTSDTLGMGITLQAGWYVVNTSTLAIAPFNLKEHPVVIQRSEMSPNASAAPYFEQIVQVVLKETQFATVTFTFQV